MWGWRGGADCAWVLGVLEVLTHFFVCFPDLMVCEQNFRIQQHTLQL